MPTDTSWGGGLRPVEVTLLAKKKEKGGGADGLDPSIIRFSGGGVRGE